MNTFMMVLASLAVTQAAPQMMLVPGVVTHADSLTPAVTRLAEPGIKFNIPKPIQPIRVDTVPTAVFSGPVAPVQLNIVDSVLVKSPPVAVVAPVPIVKAAPTPVVAPVPIVKAAPTPVVAPVPIVKAAPVPVVVAAAPEPLQAPDAPMPSVNVPFEGGQFHAQDEVGRYSFGHWGGLNTRVEVRDEFGRTSGSFAYVNPEGEVQMRKYAVAPAVGFKVAASDLPQDTPAVAQVKAAHAKATEDQRNLVAEASATATTA